MHRMQPFLVALKMLFFLGSKEAGASPARTLVIFLVACAKVESIGRKGRTYGGDTPTYQE
ncbi:hypothetical protein KDH_75480 [Dictyobacter sp. S3.2.2.5]|uniref:Secreted protein n=1 Tax=Dictyobacter halimunensis TaxID=3026934 RepID=A0ABQ6G2G8_9CHLR|nr:hypothetical protein KDH_75480 [Dictyobacter sp. S3.2.2.5]